jgi:hypothetical protein
LFLFNDLPCWHGNCVETATTSLKEYNMKLKSIFVAGAVAALAASAAQAAPAFTIDASRIVAGGNTFQADSLSGASSARIEYTGSGYTYIGVGYIDYTGAALKNASIDTNISGLNETYGLFATFAQSFTCSSFLSSGVSCSIDSMVLNLYADPGNDNQYYKATLASDPVVLAVGSQMLLATATAAAITNGVIGLNSSGGAFWNANIDFGLTEAGKTVFVDPSLFYTKAFSAFSSSSQSVLCNGSLAGNGCTGNSTVVAISQETGITEFNADPAAVPEPTSIALVGLGLAGLGAMRRRKKS